MASKKQKSKDENTEKAEEEVKSPDEETPKDSNSEETPKPIKKPPPPPNLKAPRKNKDSADPKKNSTKKGSEKKPESKKKSKKKASKKKSKKKSSQRKRKTISISYEYWEELDKMKSEIVYRGSRNVTWNELIDYILRRLQKFNEIEKDVERLQGLVEQIALRPTQVMQAVGNSQPATIGPPNQHGGESYQPPEPVNQLPTKSKLPTRRPANAPSTEGKSELHAELMNEMKNLFQTDPRLLLKDAKVEREKEEKERLTQEREARKEAAEMIIDESFEGMQFDLESVMPELREFMIDLYARLQEVTNMQDFRRLIDASIGDLFHFLTRGDKEFLKLAEDIMEFLEKDPKPLLKELKEAKQGKNKKIPKIDIANLIKIREMVKMLHESLSQESF